MAHPKAKHAPLAVSAVAADGQLELNLTVQLPLAADFLVVVRIGCPDRRGGAADKRLPKERDEE